MSCIPIVIPSLNPDGRLFKLIKELINDTIESAQQIIVINDGSSEKYDNIFENIATQFKVTILKHNTNLGKGRALKTAINYVMAELPDALGLITIDSDGQHTVYDMKECQTVFLKDTRKLVLGTRSFDNNVPFRSKFGNLLTAKLTQVATGVKISDTQTGLRIIPRNYFKALANMAGERFEFEMNMIIEARDNHVDIIEVPITTIYLEENKSSHFRMFYDSVSIYTIFAKYILAAMGSFIVDITIFMLSIKLLKDFPVGMILIASIVSRLCSSIFNYYINKKLVFQNDTRMSIVKYYLLVLVQILLSSLIVTLLSEHITVINVTILKVVVDTCLFIISYQVQKKMIFNGDH